ncbi:MAG: HNH endonuclease [Polyangiaceae bacterium]|nr:HNH endonuclease [Polyangiaceae bacterium]
MVVMFPPATPETFFEKVQPEPNTGCWLFAGCLNSKGYGMVAWRGRTRTAHRVSFELANGPIPDGQHVLHRCDVRWCVNPVHLYLGTHADNMRDKSLRGRCAALAGAKNPAAKISAADAIEIIRLRRSGERVSDVAARFGVTRQQITNITSGAQLAHRHRRRRLARTRGARGGAVRADAAGGVVGGGGVMVRQSTIAGIDPLPPVVEAVRAAGVRLRRRRGALVGTCASCGRPTLYVSERQGWARCFSCGQTAPPGVFKP